MPIGLISHVVRDDLPFFLSKVPIPRTFRGFNKLTYKEWGHLLSFTAFCGSLIYFGGYPIYLYYFPRRGKKAFDPNIEDMSCDGGLDIFDVEDLGSHTKFCRCWKSENFPFCDGEQHCFCAGNSRSPLIIVRRRRRGNGAREPRRRSTVGRNSEGGGGNTSGVESEGRRSAKDEDDPLLSELKDTTATTNNYSLKLLTYSDRFFDGSLEEANLSFSYRADSPPRRGQEEGGDAEVMAAPQKNDAEMITTPETNDLQVIVASEKEDAEMAATLKTNDAEVVENSKCNDTDVISWLKKDAQVITTSKKNDVEVNLTSKKNADEVLNMLKKEAAKETATSEENVSVSSCNTLVNSTADSLACHHHSSDTARYLQSLRLISLASKKFSLK